MALLKSNASGNFTAASTWALCTAVNETPNNTIFASTTTYTLQNASAFSSTVNADAVGVLLKIGARAAASGTVSAALCNNAGTVLAECTMNVSDVASNTLPTSGTTSPYGHWIFFKFATPVAITSGTFYRIAYKTSVNGSLSFHRNSATTGVHHGAIVTNTTQAPAATDRLIVVGDNIADAVNPGTVAGTKASVTITMDNTNATQFGDGTGFTFGQAYWGLYIGDNATLTYGTNAATNYNLRIRNNVAIGAGGTAFPGTFNMGTVATPIPRSSTATLEIDSSTVANAFNFEVQGGIFVGQGLSRTSGKNVDRCLLSANASASATSLTVDTDTGWLNGDQIYIGQTTRAAGGGAEARTLSADAGASSLTISAGLTAAKEGNSTIQAAIVLLSRNVTVTAVASNLAFYAFVRGSQSVVNCDWVQFRWCGNASASKFGFYLNSTTSNTSFNRCVLNAPHVGFIFVDSSSGASITDCIVAASVNNGMTMTSQATPDTVVSNVWFIANASATVSLYNVNFSFNNIRIVGAATAGILFTNTGISPLTTPITWSNFYIHSCTNAISIGTTQDNNFFTLENFNLQRCTTSGVIFNIAAGTSGVTISNSRIWGNSAANLTIGTSPASIRIVDSFIASQSGNTTPTGIIVSALANLVCENCSFGSGFTGALAHTSQDIAFSGAGTGTILLRNCVLPSASTVGAIVVDYTKVLSANHDQVPGLSRAWFKYGRVFSDSTITRTGAVSLCVTPNSSTRKLNFVFAKAAVLAGTTPTAGVYVRKSVAGDGAAYNGNQPRLIVRRNVAVGINADVVIATASAAGGTWELLTGSLPTLTNSGIIEIEVDCDGSAGWVNIDDAQPPAAVDTLSFSNVDNTLDVVSYGNNTTAGGFFSPLQNPRVR
jgi:hypothetical protein